MKCMRQVLVGVLALCTAPSMYSFYISNNTQHNFELSMVLNVSHARYIMLVRGQFLGVGATIDVPYEDPISFPQQLGIKLITQEYFSSQAVLTYPNMPGAAIRPFDEIGIFPNGNGFKIVRVGSAKPQLMSDEQEAISQETVSIVD